MRLDRNEAGSQCIEKTRGATKVGPCLTDAAPKIAPSAPLVY
jgi:hypothetical protein